MPLYSTLEGETEAQRREGKCLRTWRLPFLRLTLEAACSCHYTDRKQAGRTKSSVRGRVGSRFVRFPRSELPNHLHNGSGPSAAPQGLPRLQLGSGYSGGNHGDLCTPGAAPAPRGAPG